MELFQVFAVLLLASLAAAGQLQQPLADSKAENKKPNIVFILTDDQDLHMNSLDFMPLTQRHLLDRGTLFKRHFCTIALCCPSRVSLWTGKAAHNTVR
jgi:arylsulfatase A-like enzyme